MLKNQVRGWGRAGLTLLVAGAVWIPCLHLFFARGVGNFRHPEALSVTAQQLAARHLQLWDDATLHRRESDRMRVTNAEWDFMGRTFVAWSLGDMCLRNPAGKTKYLKAMDAIIADTLEHEAKDGMRYFLMPYARSREYVVQPERCQFLDGEIAMMLAVRRMVEEKAEYKEMLQRRVEIMLARMKQGPVLCAESYPDECWNFDNIVSLAATRLADKLDGTDHSAFTREWVALAKEKLVDPKSGLLISSFTTKGRALDGPEGSSIWLIAHCLRLLDEDFARDQYQRAHKELSRTLAGFAWSQEWPASWGGSQDVDSGPVIPFLNISAGASGMAFIGASSFGDDKYLSALAATLDFSAFPLVKDGRLQYCASNQVGDAALLYASVLGPIWERALKGGKL